MASLVYNNTSELPIQPRKTKTVLVDDILINSNRVWRKSKVTHCTLVSNIHVLHIICFVHFRKIYCRFSKLLQNDLSKAKYSLKKLQHYIMSIQKANKLFKYSSSAHFKIRYKFLTSSFIDPDWNDNCNCNRMKYKYKIHKPLTDTHNYCIIKSAYIYKLQSITVNFQP